MSRVFDWFRDARRLKAVQMLKDQVSLTLKATKSLERAVKEVSEGRMQEADRNLEFVKIYEMEADSIRRSILNELAGGELPSAVRGDLMRLARQIDWAADWTRGVARIVRIFDKRLYEILNMDPELKRGVVEMASRVTACAEALLESIKYFTEGKVQRALEEAKRVEELEREVDNLHERVRMRLFGLKDVSVGEGVLLFQLVEAMENIADSCEDSCDQLRVAIIGVL